MSDLAFPIKDLARRKFQTLLTMTGLIICTATTVFLLAFGENLGFEVTLATEGTLTPGFSFMFSRFILVVSILNFVAGALVISFLVSVTMSERVQDIGVMKATGCLTDLAFSYFLTELFLMAFTSCVAGVILGILAHTAAISLLKGLGFPISQKPPNLWIILLVFVSFLIASHILGIRPIKKAIKVKPSEALSPIFSLGTLPASAGAVPSKFGFAFKLAYRSLRRRRVATRRATICLSVVLTLITVTIAGGVVANQTSQNYVERAIGRDVILIGHVNVSRQYVNFLSQFFEAKEMETISYLEPEYAISENLISKLNSTPGVLEVDPRLVLETRVFEVPGVTIDPEEPGNYIPVGDHRSSEALVLGIDPRRAINEWLVSGRVLNESDSDFALIGDSLASKIFALPMKQRVNIFKRKFAIVGVCLDPLNNGVVVYVPLKTLSTLVGESNYNLLLVSIDPSNRLEVIAELKDKVSETLGSEFEVFQLNATLEKHKGFLGHIWSLVMFLPLFSLVTATLCLLSYTMLSITGQQRELGIMRALGAKPKTIAKIILLETCLIVLISGASGIFAGFFVTWFFLLPEAVVSTATLLSVMGWLLLALVFISLTSIYPALRIVKAPIARTISQP